MKRVTLQNRNRLAQMRATGIEFVQVLTTNLSGCCCAQALSLKEKLIPIDSACDLPLPGCTDRCMCLYVATKNPNVPPPLTGPIVIDGVEIEIKMKP
ncbi:MAG: hypothetical protein EXS35_15865 [Pedosphaera sp.]|nr:hypothetical protein [Pedosphaera sp.]